MSEFFSPLYRKWWRKTSLYLYKHCRGQGIAIVEELGQVPEGGLRESIEHCNKLQGMCSKFNKSMSDFKWSRSLATKALAWSTLLSHEAVLLGIEYSAQDILDGKVDIDKVLMNAR